MNASSLAINGGTPVRTKPWEWSNSIGKEEKEAVARVMDSGNMSLYMGSFKPMPPFCFRGGPEVKSLERHAQEQIGTKHVIAVNSATSGLYAAIGALGIGFGDEVIVSPYTMSACAVAPLIYGAIPVFADVKLETGSLDPTSIRERITDRTKAILVVHQFGIPAEMDEIMAIAKEHNLKVIEDCAQAWGAEFQDKTVGTIGDIGVFSFNVHKTLQCGEGGLCVTDDDELALRLQMIRNHGESIVEGAEYEDIANIVGFNYRMTELHAAIALEQLKKLDALNATRISYEKILSKGLKQHDCIITPPEYEDRKATYYVYPLRFLSDKCGGISREEFARMLDAEGISFMQGYTKPLYLFPIFARKIAFNKGYPWTAPENQQSKTSYAKGICPNAEHLFEKEMLLNIYVCPPQKEADMRDIVDAVNKILAAIC